MDALQIEKAQPSEFANVLKLVGQADMSPDMNLSESDSRKLFDRLSSNPWHELYVAKLAGNIVGTFSLLRLQQISHNGSSTMIVEDVVVQTSLQGQGIGRRMLEFAIARARELGCYKLILSSGMQRTDAHDFYESLGFRKHGFSFYLPIQS